MFHSDVLIGNLCSIGAMITDSFSGTRKKRSEILGIQILSQIFYGAATIALKGYSSTMQNIVAILRNLAAMKDIKNRAIEWFLILLGVVLGVAFNNRGLLGLLPVVANLEYSIAMFYFKDSERNLKLAFIVNVLMYCVSSAVIYNFVGAVSNIVVAITTAVSLMKESKENIGV